MMEERTTMNMGKYNPYPPTNNAQVKWVQNNVAAIQSLAILPEDNDHNRNVLALVLGRFMKIYLPAGGKGSSDQERALISRNNEILKGLHDDLIRFPIWAIEEGFKLYRQTPEGKWAPKTSGEVIPFIQEAFSGVSRTLKNCRRILGAAERGLNVDEMDAFLDKVPEGKDRAHVALDIMNKLEKSCNIWTDDVGRELHNKCYHLCHEWRKNNAKESADEEGDDENQEAGADDADRGIQPSNPPDAVPEA